MDNCVICQSKPTMECVICLALLCENDAITHTDNEEGHSVRKLKAYSIYQKNIPMNILNQLKELDDCCLEITHKVKCLIEEITRLSKRSLQQLEEKRTSLLDHITNSNKRMSIQKSSELEAISQRVLVKNPTKSLELIKVTLQQYFKSFDFKYYENLKEMKLEETMIKEQQNLKKQKIENKKLEEKKLEEKKLEEEKLEEKKLEEVKKVFENAQEAEILLYMYGGLFGERHGSDVYCTAITSDNKFIVSGSKDETLRVWNLQYKCQEAVLKGHSKPVLSVKITSDNKFIVSGSKDKTVRIWNLQEKSQEAVLKGHSKPVLSVVITSDNKFIVSSSEDKTVRVWNLQTKAQEAMLANRNSASSWIQKYPEINSFF